MPSSNIDTSDQPSIQPQEIVSQWQGPGVPNFRTYTGEIRRIGRYFLKGEISAGLNRSRSLLENIRNFQIGPKQVNVECPCCGWQGPAFISLGNWRAVQHQSRCPQCGSRSRHRGLTFLLPEVINTIPDGPALVFAPEPSLLQLVRRLTHNRVSTTDFIRTDVDFPGEDIQHLSFADRSFAFLMCNHVLEHIPNDQQALLECARILKPDGVAVFTIPDDFPKQETWYFDKPDDNGHLRHYGMDITEKMERAFRRVDVIDMSKGQDARWHIRPGDLAFICRK